MLTATPVLLSLLLFAGGAADGDVPEAPADTAGLLFDAQAAAGGRSDDVRPLYYGSEVVVVSDRPERFEPFMPGRELIGGNLAEEVAWAPHVSVGGYGASTYPAVRGLSAEHVGFEYDGVPLNNLQNGLADLALFEVLELSATIVRGPFARGASGRPAQAAVSLEPAVGPATGVSLAIGSQREGGRLSLRRGDLSFRLGFFSDEGCGPRTSAGGFGVEVGARTHWGEGALTYVSMDRGVPGPGPDWPYGDGSVFAGDLDDEVFIARAGLNPVSIARPGFYLMRQRQKYLDSFSEPTHVTLSAGTIVEFDLADVSPGTRVSGAFDYSQVDSSDPLNPDLGVHSRSSASVVASHVVENGLLHFALEGAGSYTSDFDAAMTGAVAAAVVSDPWRAWVSWGRSYRAPTMNELYWPEDAWSAGNADLTPESVTTLEAGVEGGVGVLRAAVTAYRSKASDLISWLMSETDWMSRPINVGEADLSGVELELGADLGDIGLRYAGSFGTAEDAHSGLALPYRPDASQWFAVTAGIGRVTTELRLRLTGESYVNGIERGELNGYGLVDFSTLLALPWEGAALRFEGLNITDQRYFTRQYYEMPGSEWRLSLLLGWEDDV